jgi:hypothetical protein
MVEPPEPTGRLSPIIDRQVCIIVDGGERRRRD